MAWQGASGSRLDAAVRPGPGPFGAAVTLSRPVRLPLPPGLQQLSEAFVRVDAAGEFASGESGPDDQALHPRALIGAGRALVTWAVAAGHRGVWSRTAHSATLALAGGPAEIRTHGPGLRDADSVTPLLTAGGLGAVLWKDDTGDEADARLHVAVEGGAEADESEPRVRVRGPAKRVLRGSDPLRLRGVDLRLRRHGGPRAAHAGAGSRMRLAAARRQHPGPEAGFTGRQR